MEISIMVLWLVIGVLLFFAEMILPGIGLLFAGFAALTVGLLLNFHMIGSEDYLLQALIFVVSTAIWTACLWKPLKKFRCGKTTYNNIVGETATVSKKGVTKNGGEVVWSGSVMKAKLADNSPVESIESGETVIIKEISGNILTVIPK
jgi:membrane protein implicated in regulation of membrane protease activity